MSARRTLVDDDGVPIGGDVVDAYWPYDGPHTPEKVAAAAAAIEHLARYLANATRRRPAVTTASVDALLWSLATATRSVEQVLSQVAGRVEMLPGLFVDDEDSGGTVGERVAKLALAVDSAREVAGETGRWLGAAHSHAGHLGQAVPS